MKKIVLFFISATFIFTACQSARQGQVTILHTNDMHCQYIPVTATWVDSEPQPQIGGIVAMEYHIRQLVNQHPQALVIDAGDFMTGTPIANIAIDGIKGAPFVKMMNYIDYDLTTIGNHEFDNGQENLFKLLNMLDMDVISANLYINDKPALNTPYKIYEKNGVRIGVIGILLEDLFEVTAQKNLTGVTIKNIAETTQHYIDEIDSKTDLIVLLTHNGIEKDVDLANHVKNADIIIGGHSHTRLPKPRVVNNIIICQAGSYTRNLGNLTVDVQGDTVAKFEYDLIDTWVDSVKDPNPELAALVNKYKTEIDKEFNRKLGTLKTAWITNSDGESNLGNFVADAIRQESDADFALINSGGIRKDLPAGPITKLNIVEILPFKNIIETFPCTGKDIYTLIEQNSGAQDGYRGVLQISGLAYTYRLDANNNMEIISATINGKPVEQDKTYTGASVDFILQGQTDKYFGFTPQETTSTGIVVTDMIIDYIEKNPNVESRLEGRMKRVY